MTQYRAPKHVVAALAEAAQRLQSLVDNGDPRCAVGYTCGKPDRITNALTGHDIGETVKDRVRPYVEMWILPDVLRALEWARGGKVKP